MGQNTRCDAYVGVFAWRYGYLPKGKGNLKRVCVTELEYAAAKRKKNRLCCSCSRFDYWSLANGFLTAGVWISEQIVPERALLGDSPALSKCLPAKWVNTTALGRTNPQKGGLGWHATPTSRQPVARAHWSSSFTSTPGCSPATERAKPLGPRLGRGSR